MLEGSGYEMLLHLLQRIDFESKHIFLLPLPILKYIKSNVLIIRSLSQEQFQAMAERATEG